MTRINTNVASLRGLNSLKKANDLLGTTLTRLSTGLQINNGKDNPSGLIASQKLQSQVTSIEQSIKNNNRANDVLSTADSSLGEIGGLLDQVRGLVQEGLNSGALSTDEIAANQQQIDNALSAINRIAANTTFAGEKLIDGSKAFTTQVSSADNAKLSDFNINEAVLGGTSSVAVKATITSAAEQGQLQYAGGGLTDDTTLEIAGAKGSQVLFFGSDSTVDDINNAINSVSDVTGVSASISTAAVAGTTDIGTGNAGLTFTDARTTAGTGKFAEKVNIAYVNPDAANSATTASVSTDATTGDKTITVNLKNTTVDATAGQTTLDATNANADLVFTDKRATSTQGVFTQKVNIAYIDPGTSTSNATTTASVTTDGSGNKTINVNLATTVDQAATSNTATIGAGNAGVTFTDNRTGATSSSVSIAYVKAGTNGDPTSIQGITTDGSGNQTITVILGTDAGGTITATSDDVIAAINGDAGASALVTATRAAGNTDGLGVQAVTAATDLTGGTDATYKVSATADDVKAAIAADADSNALVSVADAAGSDGSGTVNGIAATQLADGTDVSYTVAATANDIKAAIEASADASALVSVDLASGSNGTGTASAVAATTLADGTDGKMTLSSNDFGSDQFVALNVLKGTFASTLNDGTTAATRDSGTDIGVSVNGQKATGRGLQASIKTGSLDASMTFAASANTAGSTATINITGGGSLFQIGEEASVAGQIGIGIEAVNTARLGGVSGKLYELGSGGGKSLLDVGKNGVQGSDLVSILDDALGRVSTMRGRIGAIQKNVIETTTSTLNVALENITQAKSEITDADFAAETANLTKAQILNQAGLSVLGVANQSPSQVLSLLG